MGSQGHEVHVITGAQMSVEEEYFTRRRRYLIMMSFRIPLLLLALCVYAETNIGWLAAIIVALSVPIPWIAVLIANDRLPRRREHLASFRPGHPKLPQNQSHSPAVFHQH